MATIDELRKNGQLIDVTTPLNHREMLDRKLYATPEVVEWITEQLPNIEQMVDSDIKPNEQLRSILRQYLTGKPLIQNRMFKKLSPATNDVFQLKTPDLRIFGWFLKKDEFIATAINSMENVKKYDLYHGYINEVVRFRENIDLDEPKCLYGAEQDDVISI